MTITTLTFLIKKIQRGNFKTENYHTYLFKAHFTTKNQIKSINNFFILHFFFVLKNSKTTTTLKKRKKIPCGHNVTPGFLITTLYKTAALKPYFNMPMYR